MTALSTALTMELARAKSAARAVPDARYGEGLAIVVRLRVHVEHFNAGELSTTTAIALVCAAREDLEKLTESNDGRGGESPG